MRIINRIIRNNVSKGKYVPKIDYDSLIRKHVNILKSLQYPSGLFAASHKNVKTGYDKAWLRDNFYESLAFIELEEWCVVEKTINAILQVLLKHEYKIDYAILHKPKHRYEYIHARYHPLTFDEFWEDWGNKQNDNIGEVLFMIGELEFKYKRKILNKDTIRIVNKLVKYLNSVEYWHDEDNGVWEENEEVHSSSIGACVAGLKSVSRIANVNVPIELIRKGETALKHLLPRESKTKFVDLALLSLIYPFNVVDQTHRDEILKNVEYLLLRKRGVIRYKNDRYYNKNPDGYSEEAEWCFGLSWLAIIYEEIGRLNKAGFFIEKMLKIDTPKGVPELYYSNSEKHNENTPLGLAESLFIIALIKMKNRII